MPRALINGYPIGNSLVESDGSPIGISFRYNFVSPLEATLSGDQIDITVPAAGQLNFPVIKATPGTINPGEAVRLVAHDGTNPTVELAKADSPLTMPAIGIAQDTITDAVVGDIVVIGEVTGLDTSTWPVGTVLYISPSAAGGLVTTRPTGVTTVVQALAQVTISDLTTGRLATGNAPPFSIPNLPEDFLFLGAPGDGQPTVVALGGAPSDVGTANSAGTSDSPARVDHVHNHGDQPLGDGLDHAVATAVTAGFMSATDKAKLDGLGAVDTYRFTFLGTLSTGTKLDGTWVAPRDGTITRVTLHRELDGTGGSTIIDININGTSIWNVTPANRPTVTAPGDNQISAVATFDTSAFVQNDKFTFDIDAVETGAGGNAPQDVSVTIEVEYD